MMRNGNNLKTLDKDVSVIYLLESSYRNPTPEEIKHHYGKFWKLRYSFKIRDEHKGFLKAYKAIKNNKDFQI